jgi:16S rRNA (cytosine1402-N4)-methyltransferase
MAQENFYHESVLLQECIEHLHINPDGIYVDATFGGGGHSKAILAKLSDKGRLIAFDQDKDAMRNVPDDKRILFINENFKYMNRFLRLYGITKVDGILADLGVSSFQFDEPARGFSIRFDADLDMRMDARTKIKASDIVNTFSEKQLHKLFEQYGEVTNAKTLASIIVQQRKLVQVKTINDFKSMISSCVKANPNKYLAQVFQALRIEVNQEMQVLEHFCKQAIEALAQHGRLCVISFHSIEDRVVKQCMRGEVDKSYEHNPFVQNVIDKKLKLISSKPITASQEELKRNSRSRSAKLRVGEKMKNE